MKYAVNLPDLTGQIQRSSSEAAGLRVMLLPVIDRSKLINCKPGQFDGVGLEFTCSNEQSVAIMALIRKKYQRHELRCYRSKTGNGWERI